MDEVSVSSGHLTITNDMSHFRVRQDLRSCLYKRQEELEQQYEYYIWYGRDINLFYPNLAAQPDYSSLTDFSNSKALITFIIKGTLSSQDQAICVLLLVSRTSQQLGCAMLVSFQQVLVSLENDIIVPSLLAPFCENSYPIIFQPCIALILKICLFEFSGKRHFSKHGYFAIFSPKQQQRLVAWQRHWIFTKKDKPEKLTDFTAFIYVTTLYERGCWHKLSTKKAYICIRHTTW